MLDRPGAFDSALQANVLPTRTSTCCAVRAPVGGLASQEICAAAPTARASRRNGRLRREYLFKKSLEGKEKDLHERKEKLKEVLATASPSRDLKKVVASLKHAIELEDEHSVNPKVRGRKPSSHAAACSAAAVDSTPPQGRSPCRPLV